MSAVARRLAISATRFPAFGLVNRAVGCFPAGERSMVGRRRVHPRFGVGTVWREISASGGWNCLPSCGEPQCWRQAWPYGGVRQLGRVRGQAQGRHLRRSEGTGWTWSGQTLSAGHLFEYGHLVGEACCRRGGVAGAEPPHKGGPNRPDRPELQWSVVSGQWLVAALPLPGIGRGTDRGLAATRRIREFSSFLGCTW